MTLTLKAKPELITAKHLLCCCKVNEKDIMSMNVQNGIRVFRTGIKRVGKNKVKNVLFKRTVMIWVELRTFEP